MRLTLLLAAAAAVLAAQTPEFNRDIRPILSDRCFSCHGPDAANRKANLRLDQEGAAKAERGSGRFAIVPGDPARSLAWQRINHEKPALRMPPPQSGRPLDDREKAAVEAWIRGGAKWEQHWSFLEPRRPNPPAVRNAAGWEVRNPIDRFVLARLESEGLTPSREASRETLIRRLTLDLTGLPPSPAETAAFVADRSPDAYGRLVARLLDSPRYGERMAGPWLDAARYADTNGYQTDAERYMWRWRDWVIEAFNRNVPFDVFTIEQLAGDLLPNPTRDQVIATGFHRNHRANGEGGSLAEEFLVEYAVDRVETTATVWMGLTMGCARCHDHKYDPVSQKEFYQFYAFFNNIPEKGKVFKYGNSPPLIPAPTREQEVELNASEAMLRSAETRFEKLYPERRRGQQEWESVQRPGTAKVDWYPATDQVLHHTLAGEVFDGKRMLEIGDVARFGYYDRFTLAARVRPESPDGAILSRTLDEEEKPGYGLYLKDGKVQVNLIQRWLDDCLRVETKARIPMSQWTHVAMTYDGSRTADGIRVYINGERADLKYIVDDLNQEFSSKEPLRIGGGAGLRFKGGIEDARVYSDVLTPAQAAVLATRTSLNEIALIPVASRTRAQSDKLEWGYLERFAPASIRTAWTELQSLRKSHQRLVASMPTVMVMQEMPARRQAHLLIRGAYDRPGEPVERAGPEFLPAIAPQPGMDRLALARWLVNGKHPLTARVAVNRMWQMLFGVGLVKTSEDFGSQGEWPVHQELLDWLATEFVDGGWDIKALLRTIVTSSTYRQDSRIGKDLAERDPDNRLLARGPRFRLPAESIRDQALFASGLLVEKLGGPSVKPYQPAGLWKELAGGKDYQPGTGADLYRRSLYTFWKRASPPPGMMTFDSAGREACTVRETPTNTPLQALTLMNDVTYLEASRKIAERMIREGGSTPGERIAWGFRLLLARAPESAEASVLEASLRRARQRYDASPEAAMDLLKPGDSERDAGLNAGELAAYASVASLILNLDETVTKE